MKKILVLLLTTVFLFSTIGCTEAARAKSTSAPKIEFVKGKDKIDVVIGGELFTSYMFGKTLTKPVLYPVKTPAGIKVNRGFPFEKVEGEDTDHPHHVGIFFTYDEVNDSGFWNNTKSPPQVQHVKVSYMTTAGKGRGKLSTVMNWVGKNKDILLEENRTMTFFTSKDLHGIDFHIRLTAKDQKVVFGDTKEGMFAIRTAQWLREKDGTGKYTSSNGDKSAGNIWGKRAEWVTLEGEKDGKKVGIAIASLPGCVNHPTYWHARNYGLFSANPLGQGVFQKSTKVPNPQSLELTLEPGETANFNFRIIIYDGEKTPDQLDELLTRSSR